LCCLKQSARLALNVMSSPARSLPPSPPARGAFPLDHHGACKSTIQVSNTVVLFSKSLPKESNRRAFNFAWPSMEAPITSARTSPKHTWHVEWKSRQPICETWLKLFFHLRPISRGLMEQEDLNTLGFQHKVSLGQAVAVDPRNRTFEMICCASRGRLVRSKPWPSIIVPVNATCFTGREVIAGLGAVKTKKGFFGGWSGPSSS
jgi:hypothetical protein